MIQQNNYSHLQRKNFNNLCLQSDEVKAEYESYKVDVPFVYTDAGHAVRIAMREQSKKLSYMENKTGCVYCTNSRPIAFPDIKICNLCLNNEEILLRNFSKVGMDGDIRWIIGSGNYRSHFIKYVDNLE